jgi:3-deoxy-D-manno-octulosonate 8-phosphate phosphatase (KDO 8-P phosphatase)
MTPDLLARARNIRLLSCDVDGVLTDGRISYTDDGRELKSFFVRDGLGLKLLQRAGIEVAWITTRQSPVVTRRAEELGITYVIQSAERKLEPWEHLRTALSLEPGQCAHIGDDLPDLALIVRCGLGVTVPNAPHALMHRAHYVTAHAGGAGAVREVCDAILDAQDLLLPQLAGYEA